MKTAAFLGTLLLMLGLLRASAAPQAGGHRAGLLPPIAPLLSGTPETPSSTPTVTGTPPTATPIIYPPTVTPQPVTGTPPTDTPTTTPTVTATPTAVVTPAPTVAPGCGPQWSPVPAPSGTLNGVSADSPADAWVGDTGRALHWDGSLWAPVPLPTAIGNVALQQNSASAPDNVWGLSDGGAAHWNGSAWSLLSYPTEVPTPPAYFPCTYHFYGIATLAAGDMTLVGGCTTSISEINPYIIAHWDGATWTITRGPDAPDPAGPAAPPGGASIHSAVLYQAGEVPGAFWAVGYESRYGSPLPSGPLVIHSGGLAGGAVERLQVPGADPNDHYNAVSVRVPGDAWIVGGGPGGSIALHWDGTSLQPVPVPDVGKLTSVVAAGPNHAWASNGTTLLHWDGLHWSVVPGPALRALAAGAPLDNWGLSATEIVHWPDLPTFSDVPAAQPFYGFVQALACRLILSGYACGGPGEPCDGQNRPYFRPGATITRGQTAKLVAVAAGLTGSPGGQTFADVPPGHPFYLWIEQMAGQNIISGYTCGGPGEPCDAQNRPYFRPYRDVTRAQLAKIVALTAGYPEDPAGQTFADVPPGHPFYRWVEQVAGRTIISGYTCGSPGEPCDGQSRPYYRPAGQASRGQTAKIVMNTFFPGGGP